MTKLKKHGIKLRTRPARVPKKPHVSSWYKVWTGVGWKRYKVDG